MKCLILPSYCLILPTYCPTSKYSEFRFLLGLKQPPFASLLKSTEMVKSASLYIAPIFGASLFQSDWESWMMQSASIHRYRVLNFLVIRIESWNVGGSFGTDISVLCHASVLSVGMEGPCKALPPQWLRAMYGGANDQSQKRR